MKDQVFLSFDTETTGVNVFEDRIVTLGCAIGTRDKVIIKEEKMFQVDIDISSGASEVHGITTEKANSEGLPREELAQFSDSIQKICVEDGAILVAYNASFDITLLSREFDRLGAKQPNWEKIKIIDPFLLDKAFDPYRKGSRSLVSSVRHYLNEDLIDAHSSLADAIASLRIAFKIIEKYGKESPKLPSLNDMLGDERFNSVQSIIYETQTKGLEEYFRKTGKEVKSPFNYEWPIKTK